MSSNLYKEVNIIYSDDKGVEITKVSFPNNKILSTFVIYDDGVINTSFEYDFLIIKEKMGHKYQEILENEDLLNNFLIEASKKYIIGKYELYNEGVKEQNPYKAFLCHNTRDLTRQIYTTLDNNVFDELVMYNYVCDTYSNIECDYGYDKLFICLKEFKNGRYCKEITSKIINSLKDRIKDNYIEVYRGINDKNRENGLSYTFNLEVAKYFANRWNSNGVIKKYKVHIDDVVAYINSGEDEILTDNAQYICTM